MVGGYTFRDLTKDNVWTKMNELPFGFWFASMVDAVVGFQSSLFSFIFFFFRCNEE